VFQPGPREDLSECSLQSEIHETSQASSNIVSTVIINVKFCSGLNVRFGCA